MSHRAWAYIYFILFGGLTLSGIAVADATVSLRSVLTCVALITLATCAQLSKVDGPNHELFDASPIFLFAGVLLLPPALFVLLVVIPHVIEWIKERWSKSPHLQAWYLQPFNMAMYTITGLAAHWLLTAIEPSAAQGAVPVSLVAVAAVAVSYVAISQLVLGFALLLARGVSFRDSGVLVSGFVTEFTLVCLGYIVAQQWQNNPWLILLALMPLVLIYRSFSIPKMQAENMQQLQRINADLTHANQAIQQQNDELFLTLAKIFDARDPYVGGHAAKVADYAVAIAHELNLLPQRVEQVRRAAFMHDIGKIAIPEYILHKPTKLTDEEYEYIKTHVTRGAEFLETSQGLRYLAPFILHHHERWDGRGYPDALVGEEIPLESRILAVCDAVEAMASDRPYHKGLSLHEVIAEVQRCAGTQFDPEIAQVFIQIAQREGEQFIVNSAREVEQRHTNQGIPLHSPMPTLINA